jgi:hypothetical protein
MLGSTIIPSSRPATTNVRGPVLFEQAWRAARPREVVGGTPAAVAPIKTGASAAAIGGGSM